MSWFNWFGSSSTPASATQADFSIQRDATLDNLIVLGSARVPVVDIAAATPTDLNTALNAGRYMEGCLIYNQNASGRGLYVRSVSGGAPAWGLVGVTF